MSEPEIFEEIPDPVMKHIALTRAQRAIYDSLHDYGILHYNGTPMEAEAQLKPRLYPLLAGPTGSGKSFLIEQVARELHAEYMRITYGDFIPMGARDAAASTRIRIGRKLARCNRLVVHIDELDKWLSSDHEWGRSVTTDLWNLLDGQIPWEQVLLFESDTVLQNLTTNPEGVDGAEMGSEMPTNMFRTDHLWIVGSGTWQAVFEKRNARSIGFQSGEATPPADRDLADAIRQSKAIPTELTGRFATEILVLGYPSREETESLLGTYGLRQLAADMCIRVTADDVDYASAGMRALESLKTRLLLESLRRKRRDDLAGVLGGPGRDLE